MSPGADDGNPSQPYSLSADVDALADRFEAAWLSGHEPRIEDFLVGVPGAAEASKRRRILIELVMIDLEHRWRRAGGPQQDVATVDASTSDTVPVRPHARRRSARRQVVLARGAAARGGQSGDRYTSELIETCEKALELLPNGTRAATM